MQIPSLLAYFRAAIVLTLLPSTATSFPHQEPRPFHWLEARDSEQLPTRQAPLPSLVIDTFQDSLHNDLGFWHGAGENLTVHHEPGFMRLSPNDPDQNFHTQFDTRGCFSLLPWKNQFLHVVFDGTDQFTVSLNEHNAECFPSRSPFPGVPDSIQASRYVMRTKPEWFDADESEMDESEMDESEERRPRARSLQFKRPSSMGSCGDDDDDQAPASPTRTELFIPLSHFHINHGRVVSVSFTGFYTNESITLRRVEIVPSTPPPTSKNNHFKIPEKLPSGHMILRCSVPNSFAFGIDDGQPQYAQEVMKILDEEDVRVTFFVVGAGLRDQTTNFTHFYREMLKKGHQVALHSNTHPKMEALPTTEKIDEEIMQTIRVFQDRLDLTSRYFRPPFGTVGARMRQRLAKHIESPFIVNWSVDVEDWLWANTSTPEKQLDAFYRGVARGGNLAVMHFLNPTTVAYLRRFIRHVKSVGFKIMRIDQCLGDPFSPAL
ncbi:hypothetical protein N7532_001590 [Penicillium argentinense]|uniref:NodB homology domain-containing protein n=1 Tax=Penicillium argentinense TaxID=1131581 RepID=A0A9W9G2S3_9EURO|nr:uncharacterized protein N7532_001590 [Penicillium argentinense]KAJ5111055.1 hypothetical protein N7532_001590 [Penicillium argentinense]